MVHSVLIDFPIRREAEKFGLDLTLDFACECRSSDSSSSNQPEDFQPTFTRRHPGPSGFQAELSNIS